MLRLDLCDYSDVYIVVKGDITLTEKFVDVRNRFLSFKNNAPFTNCISKISNVLIDNAKDLDVVMPMYNLLEYNKSYTKTTESFWNYYRDKSNDFVDNDYDAIPIFANSVSFKYKTSVTGKTSNANRENGENTEQKNKKAKKNLEIVVPSKHLSNFWRTLDMLLINCKINLILTGSRNCVLTDIITQAANPYIDPAIPAINAPTNATFKITN